VLDVAAQLRAQAIARPVEKSTVMTRTDACMCVCSLVNLRLGSLPIVL
jgi:hypothetical protein